MERAETPHRLVEDDDVTTTADRSARTTKFQGVIFFTSIVLDIVIVIISDYSFRRSFVLSFDVAVGVAAVV